MPGNPVNPPAVAADWRRSVLQSYRNAEVREISKVLAALEGSASVTPASKLMLAMRFEDQIFKSAKDLADYRKKISKRLKKLQKNYVRPQQQPPQQQQQQQGGGGGAAATAGKGGGGAPAAVGQGGDNAEAKEELTAKLKREFGEELKYIVRNAKAAVTDLKRKLGPEKARQLQQHTDSCRHWARDLILFTEEELKAIPLSIDAIPDKSSEGDKASNESDSKQQQQQQQQQEKPISNKANPLSLSHLQRMEKHLKTRVANIRSYVVKHADPDQFLLETLQTRDVAFSKNKVAGNLFRDILKGRISTQREMLQKASTEGTGPNNNGSTQQQQQQQQQQRNNHINMNDEDPLLILQKSLEKAQASIPPPTLYDAKMLDGSLRHLDKMRAASTAMMTYWTLDGDQRLTTAPRHTLKKVHEVVQEGADFVLEAVKELEKEKQKRSNHHHHHHHPHASDTTAASSSETKKKVSLQDAWSKTIELPSAAASMNVEDDENNSNSGNNSSNKRPRTTSNYKPYYKTRMLFRPNRKTPQPLLMAIRRKGADLRMIGGNNTNAIHIVLHFDDAFVMTIYFSPLTVTLRAKGRTDGDKDDASKVGSCDGTIAPWKALSHGLTPWGSTLDSSDFLRNKGNSDKDQQNQQDELSVWGVTSSYESIGRVVEERLRDASTHATAILRKCFKNHVKDKTTDFEVELLEGSALIEFLQVTRSTYMPHWEDKDFV